MSDDDPLVSLRQRLAELEEAPLSSHPEVLERVHRALVDELEALEHVEVPEAAGQPGDADRPRAASDEAAGAGPHDGDGSESADGEGRADR